MRGSHRLGLVRGERRAEAIRAARVRGETPPHRREHARPRAWRAAEDVRIAEARAAVNDDRAAVEMQQKSVIHQAKGQAAREIALVERESELGTREGAVVPREKQADAALQEADAVLAVADGIAQGSLMIERQEGAPRLKARKDAASSSGHADLVRRMKQSVPGRLRAIAAFSAALRRLTERARQDARDELHKEYEEVCRAADEIVEMAALLPDYLHSRIAAARRTLAPRIARFKRALGARSRERAHRPDPRLQR